MLDVKVFMKTENYSQSSHGNLGPADPTARTNRTRSSLSYQTLSPVRRTFVFLGSRCTQPLTPRNAHALRYEFSKWRTGQRGKLKNTKRFCNEFSTYTLVRKANPRKKDTKLYDIEIDMILNRYRGPV